MPRQLPAEQPARLRALAYTASLAVLIGTLIGASLSGHWAREIIYVIVAAVLALGGVFAPQIHSSWQNRNQPRTKRNQKP